MLRPVGNRSNIPSKSAQATLILDRSLRKFLSSVLGTSLGVPMDRILDSTLGSASVYQYRVSVSVYQLQCISIVLVPGSCSVRLCSVGPVGRRRSGKADSRPRGGPGGVRRTQRLRGEPSDSEANRATQRQTERAQRQPGRPG